jgi:hypothetical protein
MLQQIPNSKNFYFWIIGVLVAAVGGLFARLESIQIEKDNLNKDWIIKYNGCQDQKSEYLLRQISFNQKQDSINQAHEYELKKLQK